MTKTICAAVVLLVPLVCLAQEPGGGQAPAPQAPAPPTQTPGQQPGGGRGQQPQVPVPQDRNPQQNPFPEMQRQIYLSGSVKLSDGTPPPTSVVIERVCNGVVRPEAYTDSKGNFSFLLGGQNSIAIADASVGSDAMSRAGIGSQSNGLNLAGCELRASLAGFQSDSVLLAFRNPLDNPDVGIIHIRRLANVDGYTFSITTALAPKDSRKAYEKALDNVKKQKWSEAERELTKAVQGYPKYAVAWYELGRVHQQQKKFDDANSAYAKAIEIDPKFVNPYAQLAVVAVVQQKWDEVAQHTSQVLKLNPYVAPEIYFYSAVANYNLNNHDLAENHARQAAKLDTQHKTPRINHLLGVILADKQDFKEAAEHMRIYLKFSSNAPDAPKIKELLSAIEKADAEKKPQP